MLRRFLKQKERKELISIIAQLYDFSDDANSRRVFIQETAGLGIFTDGMNLNKSPRTVASDLVGRLERFGFLTERPTYHALGALLAAMLNLNDLSPEDKKFVADLIVRYSLVNEEDYIENLRCQYNLPPKLVIQKKNEALEKSRVQIQGWRRVLRNGIFIPVDLEEKPSQVNLQPYCPPDCMLPEGTTLIDIFEREDIDGKLLVLGSPGAGKTTNLQQLALELINRINSTKKNEEQPIPILFDLNTWSNEFHQNRKSIIKLPWLFSEDKNQSKDEFSESSIYAWLSRQLTQKGINNNLLQDRKIFPLLDGLDELESKLQVKCVEAINQFIYEYQPPQLIVACRYEVYQNLSKKLNLSGAILLQALRNAQIENYLQENKFENLWQNIKNESDLLNLARAPFFLTIMMRASEEISFEKWQNIESSVERINYLLESYFKQMLQVSSKKLKDEDVHPWLSELAARLQDNNEKEILIENIQPSWFKNKNVKYFYYYYFSVFVSIEIILFSILSNAPLTNLLINSFDIISNLSRPLLLLLSLLIAFILVGDGYYEGWSYSISKKIYPLSLL